MVCGDIDGEMRIEGCFGVFLEVELTIEGDELYYRLESGDGAIDADTALVSLVIDVFEEHSQLLVDEGVAACVEVYLLQPTSSLGQITTPFLEQLLIIIIIPSGQSDRAI